MLKTASLSLSSPGLFGHLPKLWKQKCGRASLCCQVDMLSKQRLLHLASCTCTFVPFLCPLRWLPGTHLPAQTGPFLLCGPNSSIAAGEGLGVLFWIFLFGPETKIEICILKCLVSCCGEEGSAHMVGFSPCYYLLFLQ